MKTVSEVLQEQGWTQGDYKNHEGAVCLVGAIAELTGALQRCPDCYFKETQHYEVIRTEEFLTMKNSLDYFVREKYGSINRDAIWFNDGYAKTVEQVLELVKEWEAENPELFEA